MITAKQKYTGATNKLQGKYLTSNLNQVWTVDITTIKLKYFWFLIVDLASRRIIYCHVSPHDYSSTEAAYHLKNALMIEESIKPYRPVKCVHTDEGGIFRSKEWLDLLEVNGIETSGACSEANQNQVSERLNLSFKRILRDKLNKDLNKENNKTNTFQLIGEATKYSFDNVIKLTEEVVTYYNSKKGHTHLNGLTPDAWANRAREVPEYKYRFEDKEAVEEESSPILNIPEEEMVNKIEECKTLVSEMGCYKNIENLDAKEIRNDMLYLHENYNVIEAVSLSKNNNSEDACLIRKFKGNVGALEIIDAVKDKRVDFSKLDAGTYEVYQEILKDNESWSKKDIKYLETIMLQNMVLLQNIEELKSKTDELKVQNDELLDMNSYLVERAEKAEEKENLVIARKLKRQSAKKLQRRDCVSIDEFYTIMFNLISKFEDSKYIASRNRIAFLIMYFTGLRVSNLLLLNVRNIKELMYDSLGTEVPIIKGGRPNQLVSVGSDVQKLLLDTFYDDICSILKKKNDDDPAFTSEKNLSIPLHRVTFTQNLNDVLKYASEEFHKKITCHSFRISFINEGLLNDIPVHSMQKAIGHKKIQSTEFYLRNDMPTKEWKRIIMTTNRARVNAFKIKIKESKSNKDKENVELK